MKYVINEKSYIDRLGEKIEDETNIGDSESLNGILELLEKKRNLKISLRTIYRSLKHKHPIKDKYLIFKIKM